MRTEQAQEKPLTFIVGEQVMDAATLLKNAPKRKKRESNAPEQWHKGFAVEGHPPGALEAARDAAIDAVARWDALDSQERTKQIAAGARKPKEWNEADWRQNSRKTRVRSKPYEIPEAADQCKELAERAGWTDVRVAPIERRIE